MQKLQFCIAKTLIQRNNYDQILKTQITNPTANPSQFWRPGMAKECPADGSCDLKHILSSGNCCQGGQASNESRKAFQLEQLG